MLRAGDISCSIFLPQLMPLKLEDILRLRGYLLIWNSIFVSILFSFKGTQKYAELPYMVGSSFCNGFDASNYNMYVCCLYPYWHVLSFRSAVYYLFTLIFFGISFAVLAFNGLRYKTCINNSVAMHYKVFSAETIADIGKNSPAKFDDFEYMMKHKQYASPFQQ